MSLKKAQRRIDVLLTYGWNRVAYNMLRALAAEGLNVAVGDASPFAMAKASRFCSRSFKYRSFYSDPLGFVEDLESQLLRFKPQVYLPSHEETFVVAKYVERLRRTGARIPVPEFSALRTLHRKDLLVDEARKLEIPVPKTVHFKSLSELKNVWAELASEDGVVVKMLNTNSSKGVFYARTYAELDRMCRALTKNLPKEDYPIIQEYVGGAGYGVSMLFNNGELRAKFTHKRLREKLATGGTSTVRVSTENPILERYAERLLSSQKWTGVAMVEFKYDDASNRGWLIEVNPRFWGSLALPIHSGVNFPYLLYKMARDGDVAPVLKYRQGVVSRWILGDILATIDSFKSGNKMFNPFLPFGKNVYFDDFYWDDPLPFLAQCGYYAAKFLDGFKLNPIKDSILNIDKI